VARPDFDELVVRVEALLEVRGLLLLIHRRKVNVTVMSKYDTC
jgi:hypothetical protein